MQPEEDLIVDARTLRQQQPSQSQPQQQNFIVPMRSQQVPQAMQQRMLQPILQTMVQPMMMQPFSRPQQRQMQQPMRQQEAQPQMSLPHETNQPMLEGQPMYYEEMQQTVDESQARAASQYHNQHQQQMMQQLIQPMTTQPQFFAPMQQLQQPMVRAPMMHQITPQVRPPSVELPLQSAQAISVPAVQPVRLSLPTTQRPSSRGATLLVPMTPRQRHVMPTEAGYLQQQQQQPTAGPGRSSIHFP
jgi:hypothetical protein